ncbi:unnamed protein product [Ectocarpus sp. CCAP 1310/34]|nr:unnamed protein product [Ectocarpus sp. CCAP 1310/34]
MRAVNDLLDLQAGAQNALVVTLPSASLGESSTYWFGLRVTTGIGLWSEASVEVFKSTDALPAEVHPAMLVPPTSTAILCCPLQIAESVSWEQWRGLPLTVRTEVTSPRSQDDNLTYTWTLASEYSATEDIPLDADQGEKSQRPQASRTFLRTRRQHLRLQGDRCRQHVERYLGYCDRGAVQLLDVVNLDARVETGLNSNILPNCSNCRQESENLDLSNGWDDVFSAATSDRVLVVRKGVLGAGRTYAFSLSATDTSGQKGYAEYSFETNAPPAGGHVESNTSSANAGVDGVRLQSIGWTDGVDELPFTHSFGFVHGYQQVATIARYPVS